MMNTYLDFMQEIHTNSRRDYISRMTMEKHSCSETAKRFDKDFFDGERKYGYGGYYYDGRWEKLVNKLACHFSLRENARILDVGCARGFLLHDFKSLLPECEVSGFDVSEYSVRTAIEDVRDSLFVHKAQTEYPFNDKSFDLVVSINTLHNLYIFELAKALNEIERVGKDKYIVVESYRNEREKFNLMCWNLTGECFFTPEEWSWVFNTFGYTGDYEFIFFE